MQLQQKSNQANSPKQSSCVWDYKFDSICMAEVTDPKLFI